MQNGVWGRLGADQERCAAGGAEELVRCNGRERGDRLKLGQRKEW